MDIKGLLEFLRRHRLAVQASVSAAGSPQAAVVGLNRHARPATCV